MSLPLLDFYLCPICPGGLRIWPKSKAQEHKIYHKEQDRKRKAGDWQFGSSVGKVSRRKGPPRRHLKTGRKLMAEGILIKNVNRAMAND